MKSCLGILIIFFTLVAVLGGGALVWYLSSTAEFSRKGAAPSAAATPALPAKPISKAHPVR
jgi:hypothetical protein